MAYRSNPQSQQGLLLLFESGPASGDGEIARAALEGKTLNEGIVLEKDTVCRWPDISVKIIRLCVLDSLTSKSISAAREVGIAFSSSSECWKLRYTRVTTTSELQTINDTAA